MKVVNVDFVENEMVELDVAQIGLNWGWDGVEGDYGNVERGDKGGVGNAKKINFAIIPFPPLHPPLYPPNNTPKPIVPTLSSVPTLSPISFYLILSHSNSFSYLISPLSSISL